MFTNHIGDLLVTEEIEEFVDSCFDFDRSDISEDDVDGDKFFANCDRFCELF